MDYRKSESTLSLGQAQEVSLGETMIILMKATHKDQLTIETRCEQLSMRKTSLLISISLKALQPNRIN